MTLSIVASFIALIFVLFLLFPIAKVNGSSMLPTLEDGQLLVCSRLSNIDEKDIVVFENPQEEDRLSIKRCLEVQREYNEYTNEYVKKYYFVGDNLDNSYDSRNYGYVHEDRLVAKVILFKEEKQK